MATSENSDSSAKLAPGDQDVAQSLRDADAQLIENWYIACLSSELGQKPLSRTIYDERLVLFRNDKGQVAVLKDQCLHRGTFLSEGELRGDCLACPYHGWSYNAQGEVTHVPSEGPGTQPRMKLQQRSYAVVEQDGCIWVWMGAGAPGTAVPPYRFPRTDGWRDYFMITDCDNEVTHLAENFMDVPHTVFVHRGWFRSQSQKRVPIRVDVARGQVLVTYEQKKDEIGFTTYLINPHRKPMTHTDCFIMPNITQVEYHFGDDAGSSGFVIVSQCTPVSRGRCRVYTQISYRLPWIGALLKPFFRFYTRQVIEQDVVIMKNQGQALRHYRQTRFHSTAADVVHIAIEKLRDFGRRGDTASVAGFEQHHEAELWI